MFLFKIVFRATDFPLVMGFRVIYDKASTVICEHSGLASFMVTLTDCSDILMKVPFTFLANWTIFSGKKPNSVWKKCHFIDFSIWLMVYVKDESSISFLMSEHTNTLWFSASVSLGNFWLRHWNAEPSLLKYLKKSIYLCPNLMRKSSEPLFLSRSRIQI